MMRKGLTADIMELARQYGRYGYRKVTALLGDAGRAAFDRISAVEGQCRDAA
jgi:hypothetical protein